MKYSKIVFSVIGMTVFISVFQNCGTNSNNPVDFPTDPIGPAGIDKVAVRWPINGANFFEKTNISGVCVSGQPITVAGAGITASRDDVPCMDNQFADNYVLTANVGAKVIEVEQPDEDNEIIKQSITVNRVNKCVYPNGGAAPTLLQTIQAETMTKPLECVAANSFCNVTEGAVTYVRLMSSNRLETKFNFPEKGLYRIDVHARRPANGGNIPPRVTVAVEGQVLATMDVTGAAFAAYNTHGAGSVRDLVASQNLPQANQQTISIAFANDFKDAAQTPAIDKNLHVDKIDIYKLNTVCDDLPLPLPANINPLTLKSLANRRSFRVGASGSSTQLDTDAAYVTALLRDFNEFIPDNVFKMSAITPTSPTGYNFTAADKVMAFALEKKLQIHGHAFVNGNVTPSFYDNTSTGNGTAVKSYLTNYIKETVGRYKGRVQRWDVISNAFNDAGMAPVLANTFWLRTLGTSFISDAFNAAHSADPDAKLYFLEDGLHDDNEKTAAVLAYIKALKGDGVPIHGIHIAVFARTDNPVNKEILKRVINKFRAANLEIKLIAQVLIPGQPTPSKLIQQAGSFRDITLACLETNCAGVTYWGMTDKTQTSADATAQNRGRILDEAFARKRAYFEVQKALFGIYPHPLY